MPVIDYCAYFETIRNIFWALWIFLPEQPQFLHRTRQLCRLEGSSGGHLVQPPTQSGFNQISLFRASPSRVLKVCRDGDSPTCLSDLFRCLITLIVKYLSTCPIKISCVATCLCCFSIYHCAPVRRVTPSSPHPPTRSPEDSNSIFLHPYLGQTKQIQFSQPLLVHCALHHPLNVCTMYQGVQNWTPYHEMCLHRGHAKGTNLFT